MKTAPIPTKETYGEFERAFGHFNRALFRGELPRCLITVQSARRIYGYFWGESWATPEGTVTDEIALNPKHFAEGDEAILSTLVHEMCHLWQHHFGRPSGRYHNKEWAFKMREVGLIPSHTGKPGGAEIGYTVSHYIEKGGRFDVACHRLLSDGFTVRWVHRTREKAAKSKFSGVRYRYTCPVCALKAWAKPGIELICGACRKPMVTRGKRKSEVA